MITRTFTRKPMLVGMNNPISSNQAHALYPSPTGCTGHRIYTMLADAVIQRGGDRVWPTQYRDTFDRLNVVAGRQWSMPLARAAAPDILRQLDGRDHVMIFGADTLRAMGLPPEMHQWMLHRCPEGAFSYYAAPHPSGRNLWYNFAENREQVGRVLADLYLGYHHGQTSEHKEDLHFGQE